jgi:hypothetical protein
MYKIFHYKYKMIFAISILYYYFINGKGKENRKQHRIQNRIQDILIPKKDISIEKIKIIDKIDTSDTLTILTKNKFFHEYKGYRFLSNFPKRWIKYIDIYDNIGLNCGNCLYYCCIKTNTYDELPIFLGLCSNCYNNYTINISNYCIDCNTYNCRCITNVIDYNNYISKIIDYYQKNKQDLLYNLLLELNDEYGNLYTI